jgi:polar amino acid transport system substrate-binding protein
LTVGTDPTYAPFEFQNEKGDIVGFDMDVTTAAAKKAGLEVKFVSTPWEGAFNALAQGDRDVLASAITITDERKQTMDFSEPYFEASQLIAVAESSKVAKLADLKKSKIGVQTSTTGEEVVVKLLGKTSPNIKRFESTPLALAELAAGGVDAVVADNGVVIHYLANNPTAKFKSVNDASFAPEFYGLAFKKGNTELLTQFNKGLADIKADGSYQKIYEQYFKSAAK